MNHVFCKLITIDALNAICIEHPLFNSTLLLQGAQLIEFCPSKNQFNNLLWLSNSAEYQVGKSVRGGIPICWPWFGNLDKNPNAIQQQVTNLDLDLAQAHGFARNLDWEINSIHEDCHFVQVELVLQANADTKKFWPFDFNLIARFTFSETLEVELITTNLDQKEMIISQALHTYLPTADITKTYIHTPRSAFYIDAMDSWKEKQQVGRINFSQETDRLYFFNNVANKEQKDHYQLHVESPNQQLLLNNEQSNSAVIWNPWVDKSLRLSQFQWDDYKTMFCIETANVMQDAKTLKSQQQHNLKFTLSLL